MVHVAALDVHLVTSMSWK